MNLALSVKFLIFNVPPFATGLGKTLNVFLISSTPSTGTKGAVEVSNVGFVTPPTYTS